MNNKLFVGNLPFSTSREALSDLFSQAGQVTDVLLITDRVTGRPRGFGFVTMADDAAAQAAIEKFEGYSLDGRTLKVNTATERKPFEGGGEGRKFEKRSFGGGGGGGERRGFGGGGGGGERRGFGGGERRGFGGGDRGGFGGGGEGRAPRFDRGRDGGRDNWRG